MAKGDLQRAVANVIDLVRDNTFTKEDAVNSIMKHVMVAFEPFSGHKDVIELLIFKVTKMRESQRKHAGGDKSEKVSKKFKEEELDKIIDQLLKKGYSINKLKEKVEQAKLFGS